jgi:transcriptional regulator with XRE-family HTH domain
MLTNSDPCDKTFFVRRGLAMSIFHERLNQLKTEKGIQQNELANQLEITPQLLSYYMIKREPKYDLLISIA